MGRGGAVRKALKGGWNKKEGRRNKDFKGGRAKLEVLPSKVTAVFQYTVIYPLRCI